MSATSSGTRRPLRAGDWNNGGSDTPGIFRPGDARFYLRYSNTQGNADASFFYGQGPWLPVAGDFGLRDWTYRVNAGGRSWGRTPGRPTAPRRI